MIGKTVGTYRIVDQLGRGGMGTVYRAVDDTGREVAIRVLNPDLHDSDIMRRFRAEAATLAKANHPGLATVYEIVQSDRDLLMVMELVRGETLEHLSQRSGPLPAERAAYLVAQVLDALAHAHHAGIVHRDLKPANVMVTDAGGIKIMDFGLARVAGADRLTTDGVLGTPVYMAPEQAMSKDMDGRADLYSCGVVFYRLLTGALPFKADSAIKLVQQQLSAAPTPATTYRPDLPEWCVAILDRALAKAPGDRFQTAEAFRAALMAGIDTVAAVPTIEFTVARGSGTKPAAPAASAVAPVVPPPTMITPVVPPPTMITAVAPPPTVVTPAPAIVPAPAPVVAASPVARATPVTPPAKRNPLVAIGALVAVLVVAALAVVALRRPAEVPAPVATAPPVAATTPPAATPPAPQPEAAPVSTPTATTASEAPPPKSRRPATKKPAPLPAVIPSLETAVVPVAPPPEVVRPVPPAAKVVPTFPPFLIDANAMVEDGTRNREQDARVQFADGKVTVTRKNGNTIATFPFETILGITYSTSRNPQWNSPSGPTDVAAVEGGAFGIRRAGRNWIVFQTTDPVVVIRVKDDDIRRVIEALEARTGRTVVRIPEKKD